VEKRHENALTDVLETVAFNGFASVPKWRVTRWYGQVNLTVNIRRDLRDRWKALISEELDWSEVPTLRMAEVHGSLILMNKENFFSDKE